ncbi:type II secretion system minor pseudopilin GspI [Marinobacter lutaoensis]|jgi:general secretion pathway protein I|uniref:Type II secretion system protein I n=1 Tax=Marinobacter lutaoensis TaxID=135739 RepID=A0A1V2DUE0_9GAMM|nr:type II secretion system minor pseudopilin GspI [Marinobacter lutaoensis]MBE02139.1 type II secretion system protein GspI [Marinobacter sp.]MBI42419.1 type II secretion system protein GspI [Oceanospirillales bacterium]ONF44070.1 type II secretion system protein GspI [Marinobacter lutaoensis]|tara:strand:+ start:1536 stop:1910 length:375 start_codon:yes stop_codon:yes gene_type:complete
MRAGRGFTLIEVLVALLVFGLIAAAAARVGSQYIGSFERIRDKTLAGWIAENRINEARLQTGLPDVSETTRDLDFAHFRWHVVTAVKATEEATIRRIEVRVEKYRGDDGDPVPVHTLTAFLGTR